jgi:solute:Na+ symporter, SSS family
MAPSASRNSWRLLFSRRVGAGAVWWTAGVCIAVGILAKFGLTPDSWLVEAGGLAPIAQWAANHSTTVDILLGVALPVGMLTIVELASRGVSEGWLRIAALPPPAASAPAEWAARPLALVVAVSLFASGGVMLVIAVINAPQRGIVLAFAAALVGLGLAILAAARRLPRTCPTSLTYAETPVR